MTLTNILECENNFTSTFIAEGLEVGKHFYWEIGGYSLHGQVFIISWLVIFLLILFSFLGTNNLTEVPRSWQNFMEFLVEYIESIAKNQIGKNYSEWVPFVGTLFLFILFSNWLGALVPWKLIELPEGELAAPTNDINTTACLAILTSIAYFFAGLKIKGLGFFKRYIKPAIFFLPLNIVEDFSKPLSLNFRLFGNVVADELTVAVICSLVPILIPLPVMMLGLFASCLQALIFATLAAAYIGEVIE